jgi:hypothetical protein
LNNHSLPGTKKVSEHDGTCPHCGAPAKVSVMAPASEEDRDDFGCDYETWEYDPERAERLMLEASAKLGR